MAYNPANKFPKLLQASQLSRPDAQNPRLKNPINDVQTSIVLTCVPQNYDGTPLTGNFLLGVAGSGTTETMYCPPGGVSGTTLTVVRGIRPNGTDYTTGDVNFASTHAQDSAVFFDVSAIHYGLINAAITGDIPTGDNNFKVGALTASDIRNYYSNDQTDKPYDYYDESAQRPRFHMGDDGPSAGLELEGVILKGTTVQLAALPELPTGGMVAYDTTLGQTVFREVGNWVANASGGTVPNASTTVAGKVEIATQAELNAGTDTGGTGALLVAIPSNTAVTVQNSKWSYGVANSGTDAYAVTLTPAPSAYVDGQSFSFLADVDCTGACSVNFNGLGALAIKKLVSQDTITGDILMGQVVSGTVASSGTVFQMDSQTAQVITSFTPTSQSGNATVTGNGNASGNVDIDITPFSTTDTLEVFMSILLKVTNDDAGDASTSAFYQLSGVLGGEFGGSETVASNSILTYPIVYTVNPAPNSGTGAQTISATSGTGSNILALNAPIMSGNNIRFGYTVTKTGGAGTGQQNWFISIGVGVTRLKS